MRPAGAAPFLPAHPARASTMRPYLPLLATVLAVAGCSLVEADGDLRAEVRPPVLVLHNDTGGAVRYYVGDEDALALVDLRLDPSALPSLAAGATAEVPLESVAFYREDTRRLWIWWTDEGGEGRTLRAAVP